ncbi:MAG: hypothetical protein QG564_70 [Campylobacterota bacterium]|nr:hypothetical protein [Campylobacterota bacterium]
MLLSELEERERRFKLALRAAIPILLLVFLVFYAIFFKNKHIDLSLENQLLVAGIVFISVYFVYFLMEISAKETLVDQTTKGFNQKSFIRRLRHYKPKSLVLLIVDNLETLNDHYGVEEIDVLLYALIHQLNSDLAEQRLNNALIGRRYGAEFLIALNENHQDIQSIFNHIIEKNRTINDIELDYKFAAITNTDQDFEKIISQLKDIIQTQNNSTPEQKNENIVKDAKEITDIETGVIDALKKEDILLAFRPLLNIKNNKVDIYEISVKLKSKNKNGILPKTYLPIINRLGLGREYDWVLVQRILALLPLLDEKISLTFNLSPFSLRSKTFQEKFFSALDQAKVHPSRLIIQLYERKAHHNLSSYLETLKYIRAKGIRICIDNFGASNASMEYIKHFKFDMVQFDRDYVTNLKDETNYAMLRSLIKMSQDLDILTVAKWVDKAEQKASLKILGIDYLQGFGIGESLNEKDLINKYN